MTRKPTQASAIPASTSTGKRTPGTRPNARATPPMNGE